MLEKFSRAHILPLVFVAALCGCSKDDEVNAAIDTVQKTTDGLVSTVKNASDPKAGIAAGKQYLEAHRAELSKAAQTLNEVRAFQIDDTTKARLEKDFTDTVVKIPSLQIDLVRSTAADPEVDKALQALIQDYGATLDLDL